MYIRVDVSARNKEISFPINYNYIVQGFIYNLFDNKISSFLHDHGFLSEGRVFKLFTFSKLFGQYNIKNKWISFKDGKFFFIISSPVDFLIESLYNTLLLNESFQMIGQEIQIDKLRIMKYDFDDCIASIDQYNSLRLHNLSPIVVYSTLYKGDGTKITHYYKSYEKDFSKLIEENLNKKSKLYQFDSIEYMNIPFELKIERPKKMITKYKGIILEGQEGRAVVTGNKHLIYCGITAGFGSKNSMGFGMFVDYNVKQELFEEG